MNLHKEWMTNNNLFGDNYMKSLQLQEAKDRFDIQRYQSNEGYNDEIDGVKEQVVVQIFTSNMNEDKEYKKLYTSVDSQIHTGSIVLHEGKKYIVVSKIDNRLNCLYAKMHESNNILNFYKNNVLSTLPCILGKGNINAQETKYITLAADEYIVTCPNTSDSAAVDMNTRFILSGSAYKVLGVDNVTQVGLLNIKVKEVEIDIVNDRVDLGIADYVQHQQVYGIKLLNNSINNINMYGDMLQINVECTINGVVVSNPIGLTYSCSDTTICTVTSTGLVTSLGKTGLCTITIGYFGQVATITINVVSILTHNYAVSISGENLTYGFQESYVSIFTNSGIPFNLPVVWSLKADDGISSTPLASIVSTSGTYNENCILRSNATDMSDIGKYIRLYVSSADNTISNYKRIMIESIF